MTASHRFFAESAPTEFGYWDRRERYIFTHTGLGTGPLLHELTHVLAEADFPGIPLWLNEGLGSLFEEYELKDGRIAGRVNWRLHRFKKESASGTSTPLNTLFTLDRTAFYGTQATTHYAAVRHLMLWLQEQGLVKTLYERVKREPHATPAAALSGLFQPAMPVPEIELTVRNWAQKQIFQPSPHDGTPRNGSRYR
jgi:hypothetical protein